LDSRFRKFDVQCLACGPYQLRLVAQMDEKAREKAEILKAAGEKQKMGKQNAEIRVHPRPSVIKVLRSLRLFAAIRAWHNPTPGLSSGHATSSGASYLYRSGLHRRRAVCAVALPACAVV
jgi:hypothetical protein